MKAAIPTIRSSGGLRNCIPGLSLLPLPPCYGACLTSSSIPSSALRLGYPSSHNVFRHNYSSSAFMRASQFTAEQEVVNKEVGKDNDDNLNFIVNGQVSPHESEPKDQYNGDNDGNGKSFEENEALRRKLVDMVTNPSSYLHLPLKFQNFLMDQAAYLDKVDALKLLLAPPFIADPSTCSVLAVYNGNKHRKTTSCFEILLNDPRTDIESSIHIITQKAIEEKSFEFLKVIINAPRYLPIWENMSENNYPVALAAGKGRLESLKFLLSLPELDPVRFENLALRMAAYSGFPDCLALMLKDPRCDPSVQGNSAIRIASKRGHMECVKLLMADSRVDPSDRKNGALSSAFKMKYSDIYNTLMNDRRVEKKEEAFIQAYGARKHTQIPTSSREIN